MKKKKKNFIYNLNKIGFLKKNKIKIFKYSKIITIAFQRRFRQEVTNGRIDQECLAISQNLAKKHN